jgi:hypothetical protein
MCSDLNCKIDKGLCHCGCGQPAPVAKKTTTRYGHIKGQPIRYINGHYQRSTRLSSVDYVVDAVTGCWIWQRSRLPSGYGQMRYAASGEPYPRKLIEGFPPIDYWVDPDSGCRVWQRYLGVEGYALKRRDDKKIPAHRYYYEMYRGPVPSGLMMDHLCRNRACVNPYHLEPVTAKENAARRDRAKGKRALRVLR